MGSGDIRGKRSELDRRSSESSRTVNLPGRRSRSALNFKEAALQQEAPSSQLSSLMDVSGDS